MVTGQEKPGLALFQLRKIIHLRLRQYEDIIILYLFHRHLVAQSNLLMSPPPNKLSLPELFPLQLLFTFCK